MVANKPGSKPNHFRSSARMDVKVFQKSLSDKMLITQMLPKKKNDDRKMGKNKSISNRFLITVNVLGSAGPIRFFASESDSVSEVIDAALKLYGREERLPPLGSDVHSFLLYPANAGLDALEPLESIGSQGMRNFILCKNEGLPQKTKTTEKRSSSWRAWLNRSLTFNISSL